MSGPRQINKLAIPPSGKSPGDIAHSVARAASGAVPLLGGAISEIIDTAVAAPAERRMAAWLQCLTDTVNELIDEVDGLTPDAIGKNDAFITAVLSTTRSALLTSRAEKIQILRSVLKTIGGGLAIDEILRNSFLEIVERYTPEHVTLLQRCNDPDFLDERLKSLHFEQPEKLSVDDTVPIHIKVKNLVPALMPEVSVEIVEELLVDLHRDRLCLGSEGFAVTYHPRLNRPIATKRGSEFLRFIYGTQ